MAAFINDSTTGIPLLDTTPTQPGGAALELRATIQNAHQKNTSNPHSTTKAQVGLGNVADALQLTAANNLSDLPSASTARTNLGLGTAATSASAAFAAASHTHSPSDLTSSVPVAKGGTGLSSITSGRLLYASATNTLSELSLGSGLSISSGTLNAAGSSTPNVAAVLTTGNDASGLSLLNLGSLDINDGAFGIDGSGNVTMNSGGATLNLASGYLTGAQSITTYDLTASNSLLTAPTRHLFRDYRANPDAFKHLDTMPGEGETLHGVISGRYALWDLVPAILEKTGQTIEELHLATLSYSKSNAAELLGLLDGGQIKRASLVVSAYFKAQNRNLYDSLVPHLLTRGQRVVAFRQHSKVILARLADGTKYAITSSANLRSCKNVETFDFAHHPDVYQFHLAWIEDVLTRGAGPQPVEAEQVEDEEDQDEQADADAA